MTLTDAINSISDEYDLSPREAEVLNLCANGYTNQEIADYLQLAHKTVKNHVRSIFEKVDVHSRGALLSKIIFRLLG